MIVILTTHPIQYQTPLWRLLANRGEAPAKVYFLSDQGLSGRMDPGFGRNVAWDIDLLSGYSHEFIHSQQGKRQDSFLWLRLNENIVRRAKSEGARALWIQGWQVFAYWQAAWLAKSAGLEVWLRAETNPMSTGKGYSRAIKNVALRALFSRVDRFLCIGSGNRRFYEELGVEADRLYSAPYCVDNDRLAADAERYRPERVALRRAWGVPEDAFCILFVGKMIQKKRPLDLIEAVRLASAMAPGRSLHLLFVGSGALLDSVQERCDIVFDADGASTSRCESGDKPQASFLGFVNQSDIAKAYVAADCLVLPSESSETWGLVVNEAMACGLPAIVSDNCGCAADLVTPYRPDLCFKLGDVEGLATAICSVVSNPPKSADFRPIIDRHNMLRTIETVEATYKQLVKKPPG